MQECLRVHPVAVDLVRTPIQDDILPLTKPVVGTSGKVYTELLIPKGTSITVSMMGYNLYISFTKLPPRGAHIITFMAGTRICGVQTLVNSGRSVGSK